MGKVKKTKKRASQVDVTRGIDRIRAHNRCDGEGMETTAASKVVTRGVRKSLLETEQKAETDVKSLSSHMTAIQEDHKPEAGGSGTEIETIEWISPDVIDKLSSDNLELQLKTTTQIRELLLSEECDDSVIDDIIEMGLIPHFVQFLKAESKRALQCEAAMVLESLASFDNTEVVKAVLDAGAVPSLIRLLKSPDDNVTEQAVIALVSITDFAPYGRDEVTQGGVVPTLLDVLHKEDERISLQRNVAELLLNLFKGIHPPVDWKKTLPCMPILRRYLHSSDLDTANHACNAMGYICQGPSENIQIVIDSGVCGRLVSLLGHPSSDVVDSVAHSVSNMCTGTEDQTQVMIDEGAIPNVRNLLSSPVENIRRRGCLAIANIAAGSVGHNQAVIDSEVLPMLLDLIRQTDKPFVAEDAACAADAIGNAFMGSDSSQIKFIMEQGVLDRACGLLAVNKFKIVRPILQGLEHFLRCSREDASNTTNHYAVIASISRVRDKIELLCNSGDSGISELATRIIHEYLSEGRTSAPL